MYAYSAIRRSLALAALAVLASGPAQAQVTLDFENLSNPNVAPPANSNFQGLFVTQNGFTVTDTTSGNPGLGFYSFAPNSSNIGYNYTGSTALYNARTGGVTIITQNNGAPFTLNSIDIARGYAPFVNAGSITFVFIGNVQGGATVMQTFTHGVNQNLETVTFGSNFTSLMSVSFYESTAKGSQFDNIVVTPIAVPEPGSVALLVGMGAAGVGFLRRRVHRK